jgi:flavin reductase (DIM6/NTAB) family NADH-FMN oxidoreductase RutF
MLETIPAGKLIVRPVDLWDNTWLLLTSGDFETGHYNTMTVGWGGMGCMWGRPYAEVVVRPQRYTYEFLEKYDTFTLSVFNDRLRPALNLLGTRSGRKGNKIGESGLTPVKSRQVAAPSFQEAELVLECRRSTGTTLILPISWIP